MPYSPPTSPQRSQHEARQLERSRRVLHSPESRRTPAPPLPSIQPPMLNGQQYPNLSPALAAQVAALIPYPAPPRRYRCTAASSSVRLFFNMKVSVLILLDCSDASTSTTSTSYCFWLWLWLWR
jgi:hypothetical protein